MIADLLGCTALRIGLLAFSLLPVLAQPTNRAHFSVVYVDGNPYVVGGSETDMTIWGLDLSGDFDINQQKWIDATKNNQPTGDFKPFWGGVAFRGQNNNIYAQAGELSTTNQQMTAMTNFNTSSGFWSPCITNVDESTGKPTAYANDMGILDMDEWKWVTSMSHQDPVYPTYQPSCRFEFPDPPSVPQSAGNHPLPYDPTVISNPNQGSDDDDDKKKKGFGISFGLLAFLLALGAAVYYFLRVRKNARTLNPRWMPGALSPENSAYRDINNRNDYPLFVYNNEKKDEENAAATTTGAAGIRTYTASDHDQWERELGQDCERPVDGRPLSRHTDIWNRMRDLNATDNRGNHQ
ncbi:hypothetical protein DFQ29_007571 [Apophysomyces sp. BC1021]|nr:hypothetical protein DFQ29_007571 [Apophysomyces sp. BC1021]